MVGLKMGFTLSDDFVGEERRANFVVNDIEWRFYWRSLYIAVVDLKKKKTDEITKKISYFLTLHDPLKTLFIIKKSINFGCRLEP